MSAENNDFDDLDALLGDALGEVEEQEKKEPAPVKKAVAKKSAAKKAEPVPTEETSETLFTETAKPQPGIDLAQLKEQLRAELLEEMKRVQVPTTVVNQNYDSAAVQQAMDKARMMGVREEVVPERDASLPKVVHFVEDGFTIGAMVYYRGQEYRPEAGDHWALLNPRQQRKQYGQMMFKPGPWDGDTFDLEDPALEEEDRAALREIMAES